MSARKHSLEQTFYWAQDWGIPGYERYDPKFRAQQIHRALNPKANRDQKNPRPWRKKNRNRSYK